MAPNTVVKVGGSIPGSIRTIAARITTSITNDLQERAAAIGSVLGRHSSRLTTVTTLKQNI